jgi:2'-5' RNA ligase
VFGHIKVQNFLAGDIMKRVFLAIPAGEAPGLQEHYESFRDTLAEEKIKWVRLHNLHLTLHFFGDLTEEEIARADRLFREHFEGLTAFDLELRGAGVFPHLRRPRVLWFGVPVTDPLQALAGAVEEVLPEGDFNLPDKPFSPHLTIGRIKWIDHKDTLADLLDRYRDKMIARLPVREVHFIESILRPEGPEYKILYRYHLDER